jgi:hypothetical protein
MNPLDESSAPKKDADDFMLADIEGQYRFSADRAELQFSRSAAG